MARKRRNSKASLDKTRKLSSSSSEDEGHKIVAIYCKGSKDSDDDSDGASSNRRGVYGRLECSNSSSQEDMSESESAYNTLQLLPQDIQQIVVGDVKEVTISQNCDDEDDDAEDPCLGEEVVYEEVVDDFVPSEDSLDYENQMENSVDIPFCQEVTVGGGEDNSEIVGPSSCLSKATGVSLEPPTSEKDDAHWSTEVEEEILIPLIGKAIRGDNNVLPKLVKSPTKKEDVGQDVTPRCRKEISEGKRVEFDSTSINKIEDNLMDVDVIVEPSNIKEDNDKLIPRNLIEKDVPQVKCEETFTEVGERIDKLKENMGIITSPAGKTKYEETIKKEENDSDGIATPVQKTREKNNDWVDDALVKREEMKGNDEILTSIRVESSKNSEIKVISSPIKKVEDTQDSLKDNKMLSPVKKENERRKEDDKGREVVTSFKKEDKKVLEVVSVLKKEDDKKKNMVDLSKREEDRRRSREVVGATKRREVDKKKVREAIASPVRKEDEKKKDRELLMSPIKKEDAKRKEREVVTPVKKEVEKKRDRDVVTTPTRQEEDKKKEPSPMRIQVDPRLARAQAKLEKLDREEKTAAEKKEPLPIVSVAEIPIPEPRVGDPPIHQILNKLDIVGDDMAGGKSTGNVSSDSSLFEADKPVKVKSRWRRSSELEMGNSNSMPLTANTTQNVNENIVMKFNNNRPEVTGRGLAQVAQFCGLPLNNNSEMEARLKTFQPIVSNEFLTERSRSKEAKRMVCDCSLTKEEIARRELGCGDDCLNRLLMIECGSRCSLGDMCSNKRFQNCSYTNCEVIRTTRKGFGLKSLENVPSGHFLMEYVGEVIDPKEFKRRAKEYAKDKNRHYYFMALKADTIIDATHKGNISRFINHSCQPNAETQKWTVNGELRIGFFSKRPIRMGDEITFDYQLQRYGKEAQRCYCESSNCRGWIGEDPEKDKDRDKKDWRKERKEKKRKEEKRRDFKEYLNDMDLEEEVEKLYSTGLKNQAHTLTLCRLMVRAEEHSCRSRLLDIARKGDTRCLRLFLDYHGLALLWSWMMDNLSPNKLKIQILDTLCALPIQNKTMLKDSKVMSIVEKWTKLRNDILPINDRKDRSSTEDENSASPDGETQSSKPVDKDQKEVTPTLVDNRPLKEEERVIIEKAKKLLQKWSSLKEEFRIPKKQRIEQMKEHEREADMGYNTDPRENQSYDRQRGYDKDGSRYRDKERKKRESPDVDWAAKKMRTDDRNTPNSMSRIAKAQRRQLFAMKVEEEERQRKQMEEMWQKHQEQCMALGVDPTQTAVFNPQTGFPAYYHPANGTWNPFPQQHPDGGMGCDGMDGKQMVPPGAMFPTNQPPPGVMPMGNWGGPPPFGMGVRPPFMDHPQPYPPGGNGPPPPFMEGSQMYPPQQQYMDQGMFQPPPNGGVFGPPPGFPPGPVGYPPQQPPFSPFAPPPPQPQPPLPHQIPLPQQMQPPPQSQHQQLQPPTQIPPQQIPPQHIPPQQIPPPQIPPPQIPPQQIPHQQILPPQILPQQVTPLQILSQQIPPQQIPQPIQPQQIPQPIQPKQIPQPVQPQPIPQPVQPQQLQPSLLQIPMPQQPVVQAQVQAVGTPPLPQIPSVPLPLKLPPKWKSAKDKEGRTYYYHTKTRKSQWQFPIVDPNDTSETSSESTDSSDVDDSSSDDEEEKQTQEEEEEEEQEEELTETVTECTAAIVPTSLLNEEETKPQQESQKDNDLASLVTIPGLGGPNVLDCTGNGGSVTVAIPAAPVASSLLQEVQEPVLKKRREGLVQVAIISPRDDDYYKGISKAKIRDAKEKILRHKMKMKARARKKSGSSSGLLLGVTGGGGGEGGSAKCEADTSSGPKRRIKDVFRINMANVVVSHLNAYRKSDCKVARITSTEDFKHLARKLTHFVMVKELRHCVNVEDLVCNDNVKHKAKDFIKKYMSKFGPVYKRPAED